ncbi:MAG: hypothetical protein E7656_00585 [Ruminococcaceae bacterium]|nr:hypothetical protein [Oscillospiraceae bacterium]
MLSSDDIKKALELSDMELNDKITAVMKAVGKDVSGGIPADSIERIRRTISKMSENDIKSIISNVPEEKMRQIKSIVKNDT